VVLLFTLAAASAEESPLAKPLRKFDANKDGKLTGNEVVLARQAFNRGGKDLQMNGQAWKEIMERRKRIWKEQQLGYLDLSGDGKLDEAENQRGDLVWEEIAKESDKARMEILVKFDQNDDGELSDKERQASRGEFETRRKEIEAKAMAAHPKPATPGS
jgi:hypothetical protein